MKQGEGALETGCGPEAIVSHLVKSTFQVPGMTLCTPPSARGTGNPAQGHAEPGGPGGAAGTVGAAGSTKDPPRDVQQATFLWWHFSVFVLPLRISTVAVGVGPTVAIRESKADT